jgi:hypothetical protein
MITRPELIQWLIVQLAAAERTLKAREDMARTWKMGSDAAWAAAAAIHPSTAGKAQLKKADRLLEADRHARIAVGMRRDVDMYRATLAALGH